MAPSSPTAEGTLAKTPFSHLLVYALDHSLTGTFEFVAPATPTTPARSATVLVVEGHPAKVKTSEDIALFGEVVEGLGFITVEQLGTALAHPPKPGQLHGELLVELGFINEDQLALGIRAQLERKLAYLFAMPDETSFKFYAAYDALSEFGSRDEELFAIDPLTILWTGIKQNPAWNHVNLALERAGNATVRIAKTASPDRFGFEAAEKAAIERLREKPQRMIDLVQAKVLGPTTAQLLVYCLLITKQVELAGDEGDQTALPDLTKGPLVPPPPPSTNSVPSQAFARVSLKRTTHTNLRAAVEEVTARTARDPRYASPLPQHIPLPPLAPRVSPVAAPKPVAPAPPRPPTTPAKSPPPLPKPAAPAAIEEVRPIALAPDLPPHGTYSDVPPTPRLDAPVALSGAPVRMSKADSGVDLTLLAEAAAKKASPIVDAPIAPPAVTGPIAPPPIPPKPFGASPPTPSAPIAPAAAPAFAAPTAVPPRLASSGRMAAVKPLAPPAIDPPAASPPAAPVTSSTGVIGPELEAERLRIVQRAKKIEQENYFEMLGLTPDATKDDVQRAYLGLAKQWHPDRVPAALESVKDLSSKIFSRISEAHATLGDDRRRQDYMHLLKDGGATPEDQQKIQQVLDASTDFSKAEFYLKRNDLVQAELHAQRATSADPTQADYVALLAWIEAMKPENQAKDKTLVRIATLDRALKMNPNCERAYFYRGMLHKRVDHQTLSIKDFKRASELNPRNLDAVREVRLHNMRNGTTSSPPSTGRNPDSKGKPPKKEEKGGGLFGKLFKK